MGGLSLGDSEQRLLCINIGSPALLLDTPVFDGQHSRTAYDINELEYEVNQNSPHSFMQNIVTVLK